MRVRTDAIKPGYDGVVIGPSLAIARGQQAGQFNRNLDAEDVGRFLLCIVQGLRVLGKTDMDKSALSSIVDMTMRALL